ncbi:Cof-type HAD-IIB family hydrolase [Virgibacillus sp. W0430]|uniref:Cof-type HAD-IIB family hydrolase n=1 Tax=Virgibacillus sp. W0430 TaxID=3391580 RepID=UPI003F4882DB
MSKQIVFFDIDGTIYDEEKQVPASTKKAIKDLQNNGVEVAIATGRPPFMFEDLRKNLGIDTYVSYTGQHVVFEGETIYQNPLCTQSLKNLYEESKDKAYPMILMSDKEMKATIAGHPAVADGLGRLKFYYPEVEDRFYERESIFQALLFYEANNSTPFSKSHDAFHFIHWGDQACDVLPKGGSKAIGIKKILDASGIDRKNSIAFGDGLNDLEMIKEVGMGIAMGNAVEQLKQAADDVTDRVEADGIYNALRKYGLLK